MSAYVLFAASSATFVACLAYTCIFSDAKVPAWFGWGLVLLLPASFVTAVTSLVAAIAR